MTDGVSWRNEPGPDFPEDGVKASATTLEEIIAALARADEDVAAGRVVDARVVLERLRRKIDACYEARPGHGAARDDG